MPSTPSAWPRSPRPSDRRWSGFWSGPGPKAPESPVDTAALDAIMAKRAALNERLKGFDAFRTSPASVEQALLSPKTGQTLEDVLADPPEAFRPFLTARLTGWRGHRLFGWAVPEMTDFPDLRGLDCVLSLTADHLPATQTEHHDGFSIWVRREAMAAGDWSDARIVWHSAV